MIRKVIGTLDRVITVIGRAASFLVVPVIGLILYEIVARGVFNQTSSWAHELSTWLITAVIFLGGPYALRRGQFVRVDVVFARLGAQVQAIIETCVSTVLFGVFIATLLWLGGQQALHSIAIDERSASGMWGGPVWAAKVLVPIGAFLLILAWIVHLYALWRGDPAEDKPR